jgi:HEAT repeat protein
VESVIFALGHRGSARAIDLLLPFANHPSGNLRYAAVHGLMPHDTPRVVEAMINLSRDSDPEVQLQGEFHGDWAVEGAGLLGDARFTPALEDLKGRITGENAGYFLGSVNVAIAACEGRRTDENSTLQ